jgi:hypothetical protein
MEFLTLKKLSIWHWSLLVTYSRRNIQGPSDRVILEQAEARELYRNWESSKNRDLIRARLERAERIYGVGARDRIREYMNRIKDGTLL